MCVCLRFCGDYVDADFGASFAGVLFVLHQTIGQGEEGEVFAHADVVAGVNLGAELANEDVAGQHFLPAVTLNASSLAFGVATVSGTAACFFMSHGVLLRP